MVGDALVRSHHEPGYWLGPVWAAGGPSQQDGKTASEPRGSWDGNTGGLAKSGISRSCEVSSEAGRGRNLSEPRVFILEKGDRVPMCISGVELTGFEQGTYSHGKDPQSSSFQKHRGRSYDRASSTASPLMEWADCRKNAMLLSKFNDFMKINVSLPRLLLVRIHLIPPFLWERNSCSTLQHINMFLSPHEIALQARNNNVSASPCTFLLLPMNRSKLTIMANIIHGDKFLTHFTENNK